MLIDRGFLVSSDEENKTLAQFKDQYGLNPTYCYLPPTRLAHCMAAVVTK